ncbi:MAG: class I SAM-dependent methyltransferase [Minisyncoccia bacterium]
MFIEKKYRRLFDNIRECAKVSIELSGKDKKYLPGIKYLEDHFLFDLPIYRNLRIVLFLAKKIPENSKILDWGCGYGDSSYMLGSIRPDLDIISYDVLSSPPWEILSKKENLHKITDSNEKKLPFETGCFDAVMGIGVLEHVKDQSDSLREIRRVLKPEGKFYVFLYPNKLSYTEKFQKIIGNPHHDRPLGMKELKKTLIDSGFSVETEEYQLILPIMLSRFPFFVRKLYNNLGNLISAANSILEKMPVINRFSSNIAIICRKKQI